MVRDLHTLKGSAAVYGLCSLAEQIHRIEEELAEWPATALSATQITSLREGWNAALTLVSEFRDTTTRANIVIGIPEYDAFLARIEARAPAETLARMAGSWRKEPTVNALQRLASQAERLANELGKCVAVVVDDAGLRLPPAAARACATSLVHVVRNAIDHGIEPSEERERIGKTLAGRLALRAFSVDGDVVIEIADDGRGIPWTAVAARAREAGLPTRDRSDLVEALFADGLSTNSTVTAISGRGVGMSAMRGACRAAGGEVQVQSTEGSGASVRVRFSPAA